MLLVTGTIIWLLRAQQLLAVSHTTRRPEEDLVEYLPGLEVKPTFDHYAGYLNASAGRHFFYWFVESQGNPAKDPLILWLNGGPGCSSLFGHLGEIGPWRLNTDGSALTANEHSWSKLANILFLESPQCVGFSYDESGNCLSGDKQVAADNLLALRSFFDKFPEFIGREFYLAGESYAGIYVPTLASLIVDEPSINFQGFAVGNSVQDWDMLRNGAVYFQRALGLFDSNLWNRILDECCIERNASNCNFSRGVRSSCDDVLMESYRVWDGMNYYNIFAPCYGGVPPESAVDGRLSENDRKLVIMVPELARSIMSEVQFAKFRKYAHEASKVKEVRIIVPCVDTEALETYLNRPDVRKAIHVNDVVGSWEVCSIDVHTTYNMEFGNVRAEYHKILERGKRITTYFGDVDMACNHLSGMWFADSLELNVVEPFRRWLYKDTEGNPQIAGFSIQYQNMTYLSVMGAGHSVPVDKDLQAYLLFERFLKNEEF